MKKIKLLFAACLAALTFAACNDTEDYIEPILPGDGAYGAYVLNQGNSTSGIEGTLSYLDFARQNVTDRIFYTVNGQSLGDGPQDGVVHGSKLYIAMYGSDLVWAVDATTRKRIAQISTTDPEGIAASGNAVYVSNNDGYVSKIDTASLSVVGKIAVGPNPVDLEVRGGYLYVAVSDGWNSARGYIDGFRLVKIKLDTFTKAGEVRVGMNPTKLTQDASGNIFVTCMGNYGTVEPTIWKVGTNDAAAEFCKGSIAAAHADRLYVVNSVTDWKTYQTTTTYAVVDSRTGTVDRDHKWGTDHMPPAPVAMNVHPRTGVIYLTSRSKAHDYTSPGTISAYNRNGAFVYRLGVGIEPCAVVLF